MIEFWMAAGLLLLCALLVLLLPIARERRAQPEADRTALNVALYEERLAELQAQQAEGVLSKAQLGDGQLEAARELLADTDTAPLPLRRGLGKSALVATALSVPLLGLGLYLHYGASDRLALSTELAVPPTSVEQMTERLERVVAAQPDSAQALFFLGRAYMSQNRAGEAAQVFERTAQLSGRDPALLGQWAQAVYFAAGKHWTARVQALADEALQADPKEVTSLGLMGIAAFEDQRFADAVTYWQRLQAVLPAGDAARTALQGGIDQAKARALASGADASAPPVALPKPVVGAPTTPRAVEIKVQVALGPNARAQVRPDDTVFVFARAVSGPPIPLAVKRLTVAELPLTVALADADAMRPELKLSSYPEVQLMARVSRAGQPLKGEWMARGLPMSSADGAVQQLTIDSPDQ